MAPIYASSMLWMDQFMTNRVWNIEVSGITSHSSLQSKPRWAYFWTPVRRVEMVSLIFFNLYMISALWCIFFSFLYFEYTLYCLILYDL